MIYCGEKVSGDDARMNLSFWQFLKLMFWLEAISFVISVCGWLFNEEIMTFPTFQGCAVLEDCCEEGSDIQAVI